MTNTLIVVPTFNERDNITELCIRIAEVIPSAVILVIDDNSPDGTADVVLTNSEQLERLQLLSRPEKNGIGSAHMEAFRQAIQRDVNLLVTLDADLTHNPEDIPSLLVAIGSADVVIASRFMDDNGINNWSWFRRSLTQLGHLATRVLLRIPYDASSAFRCYKVGDHMKRLLNEPLSGDYRFFYESVSLLHDYGARISEIPTILNSRGSGASKMCARDIIRGCLGLFSFAFRRRYNLLGGFSDATEGR